MNEKIIIKNFGPITNVNLDIKKTTLIIGDQGTGKSCIAKTIAMIYNIYLDYTSARRRDIKIYLNRFNISTYLRNNTELVYESTDFCFYYKNQKIEVKLNDSPNTIEILQKLKQTLDQMGEIPLEIKEKKIKIQDKKLISLYEKINTYQDEIRELVANVSKAPIYIPSERMFLSTISSSLMGLSKLDIALPQCILEFGSLFELARKSSDHYFFDFLGIEYSFLDSTDFVYQNGTSNKFKLSQVSSGLQACIPMLVVIQAKPQLSAFYIIEEPELNLFPRNQKHLQFFINASCQKNNDFQLITTHSPYIIQSLNISLKASHKFAQKPNKQFEIEEIIPKNFWVNHNDFQAYILSNGIANSIYDEETGFIDHNQLDDYANLIDADYQNLCEI